MIVVIVANITTVIIFCYYCYYNDVTCIYIDSVFTLLCIYLYTTSCNFIMEVLLTNHFFILRFTSPVVLSKV